MMMMIIIISKTADRADLHQIFQEYGKWAVIQKLSFGFCTFSV